MSFKKSSVRSLLIVFAVTLFGLPSALARGGGPPHKHHGGSKEDSLAPMERQLSPEKIRELNLSEEQLEKIKTLRQDSRKAVKSLKDEMKQAKSTLKKLIKDQAPDAEILKALDDLAVKKSKVGRARMENLLKARSVLTTEQKAKLFEVSE